MSEDDWIYDFTLRAIEEQEADDPRLGPPRPRKRKQPQPEFFTLIELD